MADKTTTDDPDTGDDQEREHGLIDLTCVPVSDLLDGESSVDRAVLLHGLRRVIERAGSEPSAAFGN